MKKFVIVSHNQTSEFIRLNEVVLFQAEGSYTKIILINGRNLCFSKNLSWIEQNMECEYLFRLHRSFIIRSFIINMDYICKIKNNEDKIHMINKMEVPISRYRKKLFWNKVENYNK
ncbi:MAG: LytR/AlgR family response regulator transcription factor [Prolixibacteraceae bacterium]